ncbi:MAG: SoxR reducing system RseC family protein [Clostridia bacterium]|nr:SoxR reducing system RseC family protein [Clostridia bacterium]
MKSDTEYEFPEGINEEHTGTVVSVSDGRAVVHFVRSSMCTHCGGCMTFGDKEMETIAVNRVGAQPGDRVNVGLSAKNIIKASLWAYAVPLLALIAGILIGNRFGEVAALCGGLALCALSYLLLHKLDKGFRKKRVFEPVIMSVVREDDETPETSCTS